MYRNLLRMPDDVAPDVSTMWIREFMGTVQCDKFHDLSERRQAWKDHLGQEAFDKIMNFDTTDPSLRERAASTLHHYIYFERKMIEQGLDWPNTLGYNMIDRWQRSASFLAHFGGTAGGWRIAAATMRKKGAQAGTVLGRQTLQEHK